MPQVAFGWAHLIWAVMAATEVFRDNITQVLIFSCLARLTDWSDLSQGVESFSPRTLLAVEYTWFRVSGLGSFKLYFSSALNLLSKPNVTRRRQW